MQLQDVITQDDLDAAIASINTEIEEGGVGLSYPLTAYTVASESISSVSGVLTINYDVGNAYEVTLDENITTVTINTSISAQVFGEIIIKFVQDSTGSRTISGAAWPSGVKWPGGSAPTITATATTGTDIIALKTWDGGTTWFGDSSQDYS